MVGRSGRPNLGLHWLRARLHPGGRYQDGPPNRRAVGGVSLSVKTTKLGGAGLALLVTIAACGGPSLERDGVTGGEALPQGELLVARGDSLALYSAARGERSLENAYPFDLSPDGSIVLAARSEQEPTGITRTARLHQPV